MGLFDFLNVAGEDEIEEKVETSSERIDELRKENIGKKIAQLDIDGEQISVAVKGEVATVSGSAPSQEALEKIVLCAGNQHGIGQVDCQISVDAPAAAAAPATEAAPAAEEAPAAAAPAPAEVESTFYTVQSGDTLGAIAKAHYGDASKYPLIFEANRPMLSDPDKIYPGQSLRIPPL